MAAISSQGNNPHHVITWIGRRILLQVISRVQSACRVLRRFNLYRPKKNELLVELSLSHGKDFTAIAIDPRMSCSTIACEWMYYKLCRELNNDDGDSGSPGMMTMTTMMTTMP
jgi:hypothetical protein